MAGKLAIELVMANETGASLAARLPSADAPQTGANVLGALLVGCASGASPGRIRVRVDEHTPTAATLTLAVTQANIAAAEYLDIFVPGVGKWRLTAKAGGADATAGEFNTETDDATTATNMAAAVNRQPGLREWVVATTNSGNLILTSIVLGTFGNGIRTVDGTVNGLSPAGGSLATGKDPGHRVTSVITCVVANTDADDTIRIGATTFTAKASASTESEFTLGASDTAMAANLLAKIVAHSALLGLVSGSAAAGVITLTWLCDPRLAVHAGYMVSSDADGLVLTTQPTGVTTANSLSTREYSLGAP